MARSTTQNPPPPPTALLSQLPLRTFNHISYAVPSPLESAQFFERVLGFTQISRPSELKTEGAWICGMGVEIHFILQPANSYPRFLDTKSVTINPRADHLSFLCPYTEVHWKCLRDALTKDNIQFLERHLPKSDLRQVRHSLSVQIPWERWSGKVGKGTQRGGCSRTDCCFHSFLVLFWSPVMRVRTLQIFFRDPSSGLLVEISSNPKC